VPISLHWRWHLPCQVKFYPATPSVIPTADASARSPRPQRCTMGVMDHYTPMPHLIDALLRPTHLFTRQEVLSKPWPVPARPGVYAWYFREVPVVDDAVGAMR
jgi:hypothetical protein